MASHLYWRLEGFSNGSYLRCEEIEMRATAAGADQCTGGTATQISDYSGTYNAAKAFDNSSSTYSRTVLLESNFCWIQYQFASAVEVLEVYIKSSSSSTADTFKQFDVLGSDDGVTWNSYAWASGQTWTSGQAKTFTVSATVPTTAVARITQQSVEVVTSGNPNARVTQQSVEVVTSGNPNARVTQQSVEVVTQGGDIRVYQGYAQVLRSIYSIVGQLDPVTNNNLVPQSVLAGSGTAPPVGWDDDGSGTVEVAQDATHPFGTSGVVTFTTA